MPAYDSCHFQMARALQKAGWIVSDRPKYIVDDETDIFIVVDIEAHLRTNGAEGRRIYVEVKCFPGQNATQELYIAFGQYMLYRTLLSRQDIGVPVYLAVPQAAYEIVFNPVIQQMCRENHIMMIVVDLETETVLQWIE